MDENIRGAFEAMCNDINLRYDYTLLGDQYKSSETHQAFCVYAYAISESRKDVERKGFVQGVAFAYGFIKNALLEDSYAENLLSESGFSIDDFKDNGVEPFDYEERKEYRP
jgi:hypothetical protein